MDEDVDAEMGGSQQKSTCLVSKNVKLIKLQFRFSCKTATNCNWSGDEEEGEDPMADEGSEDGASIAPSGMGTEDHWDAGGPDGFHMMILMAV